MKPAGFPKLFLADLLAAFVGVLVLEFGLYAALTDEFSLANFIASTVEILAAPFNPGFHLVYPSMLVLALLGMMVFGTRIESRLWRLSVLLLAVGLWLVLGLFTIIRWYG